MNSKFNKFFNAIGSLRFKIILLILFIGIVPFSVYMPISIKAYRYVSTHNDAASLMAQAQQFNNDIITSGYLEGEDNDSLDMELQYVAESHQGRILIINSSLNIVRDTYAADDGKTVIWENIVRTIQGESLYFFDKATNYLIVSVPLTNSDGKVAGAIVMNKSMDYLDQNIENILTYYIIAAVIILVITIAAALVFGSRFTKPLKDVCNNLNNIISEYSSELPEIKSYTEVADIYQKFNEVLKKLHSIDESRQEFVSNVSHELKTPLTSMKVLADSINGSEDVPLEMYKEFMSDIGAEIDRENNIINDLLSLVRMDKSDAKLNISAVNMNELIDAVLKRLRPIAEKADIELVFESFRPVIVEVDEVKFTLVVTNLVENAIKYNNPGGYVHISLNSDHQFCYIKVEDNGLGIPEDSLDHVFERFYRADKSHSREIGGTGLGLAITKSAIVMHKGDVKVHSVLGEGSTFDVRIPINYIEKEAN